MASIYVKVKLLGTPQILIEDKTVSLPFRKAEALFYYLMIHKQATRDELVNLLWGETSDQSAKKNLRNAIYQIRKVFDIDIIISPNRTMVMLNPNIRVQLDVEELDAAEKISYESLKGDFLQGFIIKDAISFEDWLISRRELYREMIISNLKNEIGRFFERKQYNAAEALVKRWIEIDSYNEEAYRKLMEINKNTGSWTKGVEVFQRLAQLLEDELGIAPDVETKLLLEEILEMKKNKDSCTHVVRRSFFGRDEELRRLIENYRLFKQGQDYRAVLIIGEAGIGKSRLKDEFISLIPSKEQVIETVCFQAEEDYALKPWNQILFKLAEILDQEGLNLPKKWKEIIYQFFPSIALKLGSTFELKTVREPHHLEEAILGMFEVVSKTRRVLLVVEDLHWIDPLSLSIIRSLLLHNPRVYFVGTARYGYTDKMGSFLTVLSKYKRLEQMELSRFTKNEVKAFIDSYRNGNLQVDALLLDKIYRQTEGNPFFLVEFLNVLNEQGTVEVMSTEIQHILNSRFIDISLEGRKLLNIISIFFDEVSLELLLKIIGKNELELLDVLDELQQRHILIEKTDGEKINFLFTHQMLREYVYQQQSNTRRRILHLRIGQLLENTLKNTASDELIYSRLIYHFKRGGDKLATLKYSVLNAKMYLDYNHELFPIINEQGMNKSELIISKELANQYLEEIAELLAIIPKENIKANEIKEYVLIYHHMQARYYIREGDYLLGVEALENLLELTEGAKKYTLLAYKQYIYYGIQTYQVELMRKYLDLSEALLNDLDLVEEKGVLLRLKGLSYILNGEFDKAESFLLQSIEFFSNQKTKKNLLLNIAAAYYYLGEVKRNTKQFVEALDFYKRAKDIAETNQLSKGVTLFHTKAGQVAFYMGEYSIAKQYFNEANKSYEQLGHHWGRAISEGIMALIDISEKNYKQGLDRLKRSERFATKYKSPYELGLLYKIFAEIKMGMEKNESLRGLFGDYLDESKENYYKLSMNLLKQANAQFELEQIEYDIMSGKRNGGM